MARNIFLIVLLPSMMFSLTSAAPIYPTASRLAPRGIFDRLSTLTGVRNPTRGASLPARMNEPPLVSKMKVTPAKSIELPILSKGKEEALKGVTLPSDNPLLAQNTRLVKDERLNLGQSGSSSGTGTEKWRFQTTVELNKELSAGDKAKIIAISKSKGVDIEFLTEPRTPLKLPKLTNIEGQQPKMHGFFRTIKKLLSGPHPQLGSEIPKLRSPTSLNVNLPSIEKRDEEDEQEAEGKQGDIEVLQTDAGEESDPEVKGVHEESEQKSSPMDEEIAEKVLESLEESVEELDEILPELLEVVGQSTKEVAQDNSASEQSDKPEVESSSAEA